ncbi:zf-HC2 domain-containing protein [Streptomyces sp. NPDC006385]|uniref:zf-HC2 domain-containing protein n=1 Tax=Streptomyces sp. NPDC006385 TaxID=3156761 RepID=UPI0033AA8A2B
MTEWHASDHVVTRYANGSLPDGDAWSLEKHLESCGTCASRVSSAVRRTPAGVVLAELREAVLGTAPKDVRAAEVRAAEVRAAEVRAAEVRAAEVRAPAPPRTPAPTSVRPPLSDIPARASRRLPVPAVGSRLTQVLWAAGPAVRGAWSLAVLFVALGAVVLARGVGFDGARPLLLAVAPVVPVLGTALSYGAHADPLHEITAATPSAGLRLVLTRTAAVLAVSLPLLTLAGLLLPSSGAPAAAAWLLPGLALTLASLALAGWVGVRAATALTGGGWLCAVLAPVLTEQGRLSARLADQLSACLDGAAAQGGWAGAALVCAALLATRRTAFGRLQHR